MANAHEVTQAQVESVTQDLEHGKTASAHTLLDSLSNEERASVQKRIIEQNATDRKEDDGEALPVLSLSEDGRSIQVRGFAGTEQLWRNRPFTDDDEYTAPAENVVLQWGQDAIKAACAALNNR